MAVRAVRVAWGAAPSVAVRPSVAAAVRGASIQVGRPPSVAAVRWSGPAAVRDGPGPEVWLAVVRTVVRAAAADAAVVVRAVAADAAVGVVVTVVTVVMAALVRGLVGGVADVAGGIVRAVLGLRAGGKRDGGDRGGGEKGLGDSVSHGGLQ
jgi:hypothetical protein